MLAHVGPSWAIRSEKWQKVGRAQNTVKHGSFWRSRVVAGRGGGPSLLRRGENRLRQGHVGRAWFVHERLGLVGCAWSMSVWGCCVRVGQWQFVLLGVGFVQQSLGLVGWGWSVGFVHESLGLVGWGWSVVVCAYAFGVGGLELVGRGLDVKVGALRCGVGAMWAHLGAMWAHLGATLAYLEGNVGPSCGYVGPSRGYLGPCRSYVGPSWGYVGPAWRLCWPILELCWPSLSPMLAHVGPSWGLKSEKRQKVGRAQNTVKRGIFWRYEVVGGRGGGPSLLRRGENRLRQCHGQGAPGRIYEAYAWQPGAGQSRPVEGMRWG